MSKNQNATHIFPICFPASKRLKVEPHWLKSPSSLYKLIKPNLPRECGVFPTIAHVTPDTWHSEETAIVENNHSLFTIKVYSFITALQHAFCPMQFSKNRVVMLQQIISGQTLIPSITKSNARCTCVTRFILKNLNTRMRSFLTFCLLLSKVKASSSTKAPVTTAFRLELRYKTPK